MKASATTHLVGSSSHLAGLKASTPREATENAARNDLVSFVPIDTEQDTSSAHRRDHMYTRSCMEKTPFLLGAYLGERLARGPFALMSSLMARGYEPGHFAVILTRTRQASSVPKLADLSPQPRVFVSI